MTSIVDILKNWKPALAGGSAVLMLGLLLTFLIDSRTLSQDEMKAATAIVEQLYHEQHAELQRVKEERDFATSALDIISGARDAEPLITWVKDLDGKYVDVNQAFYDNLIVPNELDPQRVIGFTDFQIWPDTALASKYRRHDLEVIRLRQMKRFKELATIADRNVPYISYKYPVFGIGLGQRRIVIATAGVAHEDCE